MQYIDFYITLSGSTYFVIASTSPLVIASEAKQKRDTPQFMRVVLQQARDINIRINKDCFVISFLAMTWWWGGQADCFVTLLLAGDGSRHSIIENPSGTPCHLPLQERLYDHCMLGEARRKTGVALFMRLVLQQARKLNIRINKADVFCPQKAVVYDAATAGIARTFCGMFTVGTKASPERGGGTKCRRG